MTPIFFSPTFSKQLRKLPSHEFNRVEKALIQLEQFLKTGEKREGLGFKKIGAYAYEIRVDIHKRIVLRKDEERYYVMIYGNHDDIERFLKRQ